MWIFHIHACSFNPFHAIACFDSRLSVFACMKSNCLMCRTVSTFEWSSDRDFTIDTNTCLCLVTPNIISFVEEVFENALFVLSQTYSASLNVYNMLWNSEVERIGKRYRVTINNFSLNYTDPSLIHKSRHNNTIYSYYT